MIFSDDLEETYVYLAGLPPFSKWKLPRSTEIAFEVNRSQQMQGEYDTDPHTIKVSSYFCKTWTDVLETVAHEMVHLHLEKSGHYSHADHGKAFKRCAAQVCKSFGWDKETF